MPNRVVDLSALSQDVRKQPFSVHFWECTPNEYQRFLWNPRAFLEQIGIRLPPECRIETTIENHDWIGERSDGMKPRTDTLICNIGGGDLRRSVYRIICFGRELTTRLRAGSRNKSGADGKTNLPASGRRRSKKFQRGPLSARADGKGKRARAPRTK
jgi:hypothetical protein